MYISLEGLEDNDSTDKTKNSYTETKKDPNKINPTSTAFFFFLMTSVEFYHEEVDQDEVSNNHPLLILIYTF